ncbi:MAG: M20/M25/M40 family metallo-hydrolase [Bdellovibrionota bacterium]|nr:MAG: M20/M25/M40 family metallo-hydrolase [Bdellovibrionota bacterium]
MPALEAHHIPEWSNAALPHALESLRTLVGIESVSENVIGVQEVQAALQRELEALGLLCERRTLTDRGDVVIATTAAGRDTRARIVLCGHADIALGFSEGYHSLTVDGERARGPGAYDMKAGLIVITYACRALKEMGMLDRLPLEIVFNSAEESSTQESRDLMRQVAAEARAALVFEFGRDNDALVTERSCLAEFILTVTGRSAHMGNEYAKGANAAFGLAERLLAMERMIDLPNGAICNAGLISVEAEPSRVADRARATVQCRAFTNEDLERIEAGLKQLRSADARGCTAELARTKLFSPLEETPASRELYEQYKAACKRAGFEAGRAPRQGGVSDANHLGSKTPTIDALGPKGGGAHTKDEFVIIPSILQRVEALIYFLISQPEARQ